MIKQIQMFMLKLTKHRKNRFYQHKYIDISIFIEARLAQQQSYCHMSRVWILCLVVLVALSQASESPTGGEEPENVGQSACTTFVKQFYKNITELKPSSVPTIIYSGITTNNPGQFKECRDENYSYFMLYFDNTSLSEKTYTGACLPNVCNADNLKETLIYFNITNADVYDYPADEGIDGLAITGTVIIGLWISVLVVWSCVVSFKEDQIKTLVKKDETQRTSINAQSNEPLIETVDSVVPEVKLFNFYEGYQELFKPLSKKSIFSPIMFFAVLSYLISVELSYRLSISENMKTTAQELLNSFFGVLTCNTEIALHTIVFVMGLRLAYSAYKIDTFKALLRFYFDQAIKRWVVLFLMTLLIYSFVIVFTSEPLNTVWKINVGGDCPGYIYQLWFLFRNMITDTKACLPWMSLIAAQLFFLILAGPFLLIFRSNKKLGYGLFGLIIVNSMLISVAVLDSKKVLYEPTLLMNGQREYALDYQPNTFVRMGAYFFGLVVGLFMIEGLEKSESQKSTEADFAKTIRRNNNLQIVLQIAGLGLMLATYLLIIPYLDIKSSYDTPYAYVVLVPFFFLVGLAAFMLPSFWEGEGVITRFINTVFGWKKWVHLDRISLTFFMVGPMYIGFSCYNVQSSIYYDFITVLTYGIGDIVISYLMALLVASSFEYQVEALSNWLQHKVYGNENKYSVLVIEQQ